MIFIVLPAWEMAAVPATTFPPVGNALAAGGAASACPARPAIAKAANNLAALNCDSQLFLCDGCVILGIKLGISLKC